MGCKNAALLRNECDHHPICSTKLILIFYKIFYVFMLLGQHLVETGVNPRMGGKPTHADSEQCKRYHQGETVAKYPAAEFVQCGIHSPGFFRAATPFSPKAKILPSALVSI